MSFLIKLKTFKTRFLVFLLPLFFFLASSAALNAQTAEISALPQQPSNLQAGEQSAEIKIEISGKIEETAAAQQSAAANTPGPPAQQPKFLKVNASKDTVFITPGETLDLSSITLKALTSSGAIESVNVESWSADTGSVNLNVYTPPNAEFKGIVALFAHYMDGGVIKKRK